jgi:hypothetical protein
MELFLPTLGVLLLSGVFVFGIVPKISPTIIFILTVIFFAIAVYAHYMMFKQEYTLSLWRDSLQNSVPLVFGIIIGVGILIATLNMFTNIKITMPTFSVFKPKEQAFISNKPKYSDIPIEKIMELEKQL